MLPWLYDVLVRSAGEGLAETSGEARTFLIGRTALAAVSSFLAALLLGPGAIRWLHRQKVGERVDSASAQLNKLHAAKGQTPTMGGLFLVAAAVVAVVLWGNWRSPYLALGTFVLAAFGAIGAADDWIKLRTPRRGLTVRQKLGAQMAAALAAAGWLYVLQRAAPAGTSLVWPVGSIAWPLGAGIVVWSVLVLVASSNGVNLTDGLDGLASGCLLFAGAAMTLLAYAAGNRILAEDLQIPYFAGVGELSVLLGATLGGVLGFLWFNAHPAQIFMGDAGSLPLGALLGLAALASRQEARLVLIGGVFVIETLSVVAQVTSFKLTGRRVLACSPLHNHFVFRGDSETKIVVRFWIAAAILALAGLGSLTIR